MCGSMMDRGNFFGHMTEEDMPEISRKIGGDLHQENAEAVKKVVNIPQSTTRPEEYQCAPLSQQAALDILDQGEELNF